LKFQYELDPIGSITPNQCRHELIRALKSRDLSSRDMTARHQLNDKRTDSCMFLQIRQRRLRYSRLQFLRAVRHSVGAHTQSLEPPVDSSSSSSAVEDVASQAPVPAATTSAA